MINARITDNQVEVYHGGMWTKGNLQAWNEWYRCNALRNHNPDCAKRADEIRAALREVGYFEETE